MSGRERPDYSALPAPVDMSELVVSTDVDPTVDSPQQVIDDELRVVILGAI